MPREELISPFVPVWQEAAVATEHYAARATAQPSTSLVGSLLLIAFALVFSVFALVVANV